MVTSNLEATPSDILFEKPTQQNNDGRFPSIKAATLDRLVERLTYELYTGALTLNSFAIVLTFDTIDSTFRTAFLYTYRTFTTPKHLLDKLIAR